MRDMAVILEKIMIWKLRMTRDTFDFTCRVDIKSQRFSKITDDQASHLPALYWLEPCISWLCLRDTAIVPADGLNSPLVPWVHVHQGCMTKIKQSMTANHENGFQTSNKTSSSDGESSGDNVMIGVKRLKRV